MPALRNIDKSKANAVFNFSIVGISSEKGYSEYSSTKVSLLVLAQTWALLFTPEHIKVYCISPALVQTPMLKSMTEILPEESFTSIIAKHLFGFIDPSGIANLCVYLISDVGLKSQAIN